MYGGGETDIVTTAGGNGGIDGRVGWRDRFGRVELVAAIGSTGIQLCSSAFGLSITSK